MELAFADKEIRKFCLSANLAEEQVGASVASALRRRLADLSAAENMLELFEVPAGLETLNEHSARWSMTIFKGYKLIFESGHQNTSWLENGKIDPAGVRRIKILRLETSND